MHQFSTDPVLRMKLVKFVQGHRHDLRTCDQVCRVTYRTVYFEGDCHVALQLEVHRETEKKILKKGCVSTRDTIISPSLKSQSEANGR